VSKEYVKRKGYKASFKKREEYINISKVKKDKREAFTRLYNNKQSVFLKKIYHVSTN
jgi:hypothetical protein